MKPIAPAAGLSLPLGLGLAGIPLWIEAPLWGAASAFIAAAWAYGTWRQAIDQRSPLPPLEGERFAPLDVSIAWRTGHGEFPALRRGWQVVLTEDDLWLCPIRPNRFLGGDRDHVRIPRLDIVGCTMATDTEVRLRFMDEESRIQEVRLSHVPRASELASALGYERLLDVTRDL